MRNLSYNNINVTSGNPTYSSALGTQNTSTGYYSFIGGSNSYATGSHSFGFGQDIISEGTATFALGYNSRASNNYSFAFGRNVWANAENAFIIGKGTMDMSGDPAFINTIPNSLMIGFNTTIPSFFVQSFDERLDGGFVGIHTTTPTSELDVNGTITTLGFKMTSNPTAGYVLTSDADGNASWQPNDGSGGGSGGDSYWTANGQHIYFISASGPLGNGNVGIGPASSNPLEKLHVFGNIKTDGYLRGGETSGALKVQSNYGYTIVGAKDANASYFETDRQQFVFNKKAVMQDEIYFNSISDGVISFGAENGAARNLRIISKYNGGGAGKSLIRGICINADGWMGIGTDAPSADLDVDGTTRTNQLEVSGKTKTSELQITSGASTAGYILTDSDGNGNAVWTDIETMSGVGVWDVTNNVAHYSEKVAVNTNYVPDGFEFAVNGDIICEKIEVKLETAWPDFVFEEDYQLQSLTEIESFVKENKHLPGVPSAEEVKENGQDLGEMNTILLQKIEELTLLMIAQQKEIDALKKQVNQ